MIYDPELKSALLAKLKWLNEFIRELQSFAAGCKINIEDDKIYIAATAQREILREIIDNKFH